MKSERFPITDDMAKTPWDDLHELWKERAARDRCDTETNRVGGKVTTDRGWKALRPFWMDILKAQHETRGRELRSES